MIEAAPVTFTGEQIANAIAVTAFALAAICVILGLE